MKLQTFSIDLKLGGKPQRLRLPKALNYYSFQPYCPTQQNQEKIKQRKKLITDFKLFENVIIST